MRGRNSADWIDPCTRQSVRHKLWKWKHFLKRVSQHIVCLPFECPQDTLYITCEQVPETSIRHSDNITPVLCKYVLLLLHPFGWPNRAPRLNRASEGNQREATPSIVQPEPSLASPTISSRVHPSTSVGSRGSLSLARDRGKFRVPTAGGRVRRHALGLTCCYRVDWDSE